MNEEGLKNQILEELGKIVDDSNILDDRAIGAIAKAVIDYIKDHADVVNIVVVPATGVQTILPLPDPEGNLIGAGKIV